MQNIGWKRIIVRIIGGLLLILGGDSSAWGSGLVLVDANQQLLDFYETHQPTTTGVAVAFRNDKGQVLSYFGFSDVENEIAVDRESVFEWGSVSKLLVWVSVMQQVEQGRLELEADVRQYLPPELFSNIQEATTLLDLMNHAGGFEDVLVGLFEEAEGAALSLEEALARQLPRQVHSPGEVTVYSNWGTSLAAYVVERTSGLSFSDYVRANIFTVLGMEQTALQPDLADNLWVKEQRQLMQGYTTDGQLIKNNRRSIPLYPAGMATGTLPDLQYFLDGLVTSDSGLFAKAETYQQLFAATKYYNEEPAYPYNAHGFWAHYFAEGLYYGHGGNSAAHSAYVLIDPETKSTVAVMTNQKNESAYTVELPLLVLGDYQPKQFSRPVASSTTKYRMVNARNLLQHTFTPLLAAISNTVFTFNSDGMIFHGYTAEEIAEDIYYLGGLLYSRQEKAGSDQVKVTAVYSDYLEVSPGTYRKQQLLLLLWGLIALWAGGLLLYWLIQRLRGKLQKHSNWRLLWVIALLLSFAAAVVVVMQVSALASYAAAFVAASAALLLAVLALVVGILTVKKTGGWRSGFLVLLPLLHVLLLFYYHLTPWF